MGLNYIHSYLTVYLPVFVYLPGIELPLNGIIDYLNHTLLHTPGESSPYATPHQLTQSTGSLSRTAYTFSQAGGPHSTLLMAALAPSARQQWNRTHLSLSKKMNFTHTDGNLVVRG